MSYSYHLRDVRFVSQEKCKRVPSYCCIKQFYRCRNWLRKVFEDQQNCRRQKILSERLKREAQHFGSFVGSVGTTAYKEKVNVYHRKFDRGIWLSSRHIFLHISIRGLLLLWFKQNGWQARKASAIQKLDLKQHGLPHAGRSLEATTRSINIDEITWNNQNIPMEKSYLQSCCLISWAWVFKCPLEGHVESSTHYPSYGATTRTGPLGKELTN